jgi:hypothetical protein
VVQIGSLNRGSIHNAVHSSALTPLHQRNQQVQAVKAAFMTGSTIYLGDESQIEQQQNGIRDLRGRDLSYSSLRADLSEAVHG